MSPMECPEETIQEGQAKIKVPKNSDIGRKAEIFYNTRMKIARDVAVFIANYFKPKTLCDCFGGSGVRSIRLALESKIKHITICDIKEAAIKNIKRNVQLSSAFNADIFNIVHTDVLRLLQNIKDKKFDFIDIDPFGSPVGFIRKSLSALNKKGILAVTATDVSCLSGRYIKACIRKYQARPLRCGFAKEVGVRILIGKTLIESAKEGKILEPIFCHSSNHFLRAYFQFKKEAQPLDNKNFDISEVSELYNKTFNESLGYISLCHKCLKWELLPVTITPKSKSCRNCGNRVELGGPLWLGKLWHPMIAQKFGIIKYIKGESRVPSIGFYETHDFASVYSLNPPKVNKTIEALEEIGFKASRTHFSSTGLRSNAHFDEFIRLFFSK